MTYHYNKDNRLTKAVTGAGAQVSYQYDGNGNVTSVSSGSERLSSYSYDQEDQLISATKGTGDKASTSTYTYDAVGNLTSVTNGKGKVTKYSYDQLSNLVERVSAMGQVETYTYNINNKLSQVKKADGKTISYDYNKLDQLLTKKPSEQSEGQVLYTYDADGRRVSMRDLTGQTSYAYNAEGELTGLRQGDGSLIQYSYDDFGNITKMTYPDGSQVSYSYDELDRLTSVTDKDGMTTTYTYNKAGDMTEIRRGDGTSSQLTYDQGHRVVEITHRDKQDKVISSYAYDYDDGNYITKETITQDGQTLVQAYTYDQKGQLETLTVLDKAGATLASFSYTYDLAGNKLTSTETRDGKTRDSNFTYDDNNRLTQIKTGDKVITYTYDQNGNRIKKSGSDDTLDYIYDTENRLLAVKDKEGVLFAALYDGDSNRVFTASRTKATNTYQLFKRQEKKRNKKSPYTSASGDQNSLFWYGFTQNVIQFFSSFGTSEGYNWIETFDTISVAYHQKVAKDRATKEGLVVNPPSEDNLPGQDQVTYASEVQDVLIPYTTKEDTYNYYEVRNYVNDVNREHTQVLQTYDDQLKQRETYTYGKGRASYHNHSDKQTYNYLTNQAGTVTGLTRAGNAVASSSYNPYGSSKASTDATGNPFAYNGEARDVTGLDFLRARYYDSHAGTFLTEDSYPGSLTDPLSQNRYAYVQNNPVNYTDPSGHRSVMMERFGGLVDTKQQRYYSQFQILPSDFSPSLNGGGQSLKDYTENLIRTNPNYRAPDSYYEAFGPNAVRYKAPDSNSYKKAQYQAAVDTPTYNAQQALIANQNAYRNVGGKGKLREADNLYKNWTKAYEEAVKHVCDPKTTKAGDQPAPSATEYRSWLEKHIENYGFNKEYALKNPQYFLPLMISQQKGEAFAQTTEGKRQNAQVLSALAGAATSLLTGNPILGMAVYGGLNSTLNSVIDGDPIKDVVTKGALGTVMGAGTGYLTGTLSGGGLIAKYAGVTLAETGLDQGLSAINGNQVTASTIGQSLAINGLTNLAVGGLEALVKSASKVKVPETPPNGILSDSEAEELAFEAISGKNKSEAIVLGKYDNGGPSAYTNVAKSMDAQYFELKNWDELSSIYSNDEIWKINQKFLDIQMSSGREIYLSHDPKGNWANSFYKKELNYLLNNGYHFVKEGDIWHALR